MDMPTWYVVERCSQTCISAVYQSSSRATWLIVFLIDWLLYRNQPMRARNVLDSWYNLPQRTQWWFWFQLKHLYYFRSTLINWWSRRYTYPFSLIQRNSLFCEFIIILSTKNDETDRLNHISYKGIHIGEAWLRSHTRCIRKQQIVVIVDRCFDIARHWVNPSKAFRLVTSPEVFNTWHCKSQISTRLKSAA